VQRGGEPPKQHPYGFVTLIPPRVWWTAIWNDGAAGRYEIYADVGTPPEWDGDVVRVVDLDLDVVRYRSGEVAVLDEDEFRVHREAFGYPARVVDTARTTAAALATALEGRREPFGTAGPTWLERLAARGDGPAGT
jgi:protein associated with RNAse G/E